MKVCVAGLWHLGCVTAACLTIAGHEVRGFDPDAAAITQLRAGHAPLFEPGLDELIHAGVAGGRLSFTPKPELAVPDSDILWITYDTPVDDDDRADVDGVVRQVTALFPYLSDGTLVIVSSQLPVGSTARLEQSYAALRRPERVTFAYSPENLRLGKAVEIFTRPDRIVVGIRSESDRERIASLLAPMAARIEWMSVESAEMTKHAINAFLATSVTFINEIAVLCEQVGADATEVERGLKTESRIGPRAYLKPGPAFAGGTLARDIAFLTLLAGAHGRSVPLLSSVKESNDLHKRWVARTLEGLFGELRGVTVGVWGLTYKPGTNTLRRSSAVELCHWLAGQSVRVRVHDPTIQALPQDLAGQVTLCATAVEAARGADAVVLATEWPEYRSLSLDRFPPGTMPLTIIDPSRFLGDVFNGKSGIRYMTIGQASR